MSYCDENLNTASYKEEYADKLRSYISKRFGLTLKAFVKTYGCQQNVSDGEKIKGILNYIGYNFCDNPKDADLIIYNTCAIRENAEDRMFGKIGELKALKKENPNMVIAICGCMTQQEHIEKRIKKSYPQVDLVLGTNMLKTLPEMLYKVLKGRKRFYETKLNSIETYENIPAIRDKEYNKASLPIMYGCDNFCTYCVVPYVRGRERSRDPDVILNEFKELVAKGYKEITLLGQNVNSYGKGLEQEIDFPTLLSRLNDVEGDFWIRFMSSHPKDASFKLIDTIASCEKVCNHFHLPIQSGSDRILSLMNRKYTKNDYIKLVEYARSKMPDIAFTSDIIVGFPTETEEDFYETIKLIDEVKFDSIFSFIYSKRENTKATLIEDSTKREEKNERFDKLLKAQKRIGKQKYESCVGKTYRVLVDGIGDEEGFLTGRTQGYMIVNFKGDLSLKGQFVNIKITKSLGWALQGEIIS